jgi:hypothetical protein
MKTLSQLQRDWWQRYMIAITVAAIARETERQSKCKL